MTPTQEHPRSIFDVHLASCLEDYASGRLESPREEEVETHLLVCDPCFAAYVALLVRRD